MRYLFQKINLTNVVTQKQPRFQITKINSSDYKEYVLGEDAAVGNKDSIDSAIKIALNNLDPTCDQDERERKSELYQG